MTKKTMTVDTGSNQGPFLGRIQTEDGNCWFINTLILSHVDHAKYGLQSKAPGTFLETLHLVRLPYYRMDVISRVEINKTISTRDKVTYNLTVRTKEPMMDIEVWDDLLSKLGLIAKCPEVPVKSPSGEYMWMPLITEEAWTHLFSAHEIIPDETRFFLQVADRLETMDIRYA